MTIEETAKKFGCTQMNIYHYIKSGKLRPSIVDGRYVVPDDATRPSAKRGGRTAGSKNKCWYNRKGVK